MKNTYKSKAKKILFSIATYFSLSLPLFVMAEDTKIVNPIPNVETLNELIKTVLEGLIKIGLPILALAVIYSGFLFVAAQGNSEKISEAKKSLMYTLLGSAILLGSWAIAQLISETVLSL